MILVTLLLSSFVHQLVPSAEIDLKARGAVSIPLVCDARKGLFVPVSVQGAPARLFVLDTGSSVTVIDDRSARERSLAPAGRIASSSGSDPLVTAQLTVGPVALPPGQVVTADGRQLSRLLGNVGGILGSDALRALGRTAIDMGECRLTVGGSDPGGGAVRVPFEWHQGRPVIAVGGGARLVLDSGATTVTVFSDAAAAATLRWTSREATIVRIDRLDGATVGRLGELACLTVGKMELRNIPAVAVRSWYDKRDARAPDGLLPLALFSRVHIAPAEGYVWLVPASH